MKKIINWFKEDTARIFAAIALVPAFAFYIYVFAMVILIESHFGI